jgi:protein transport protein SEC61 subunit gamma-like protein
MALKLNIMENLRSFIANSRRVLVIAKKPDRKEFETMAKVTGIGIVIVGAIAYVIYLIFAFLPL